MSTFVLSRAIERFLVPWTRLDWPLDPGAIFGRAAPLGIELGFGNGDFLQHLARERPEMNWIGAEISWVSLHHLLRRLHREGIENVRAVQGDGAFLVERCFGPGAFEEIVINHPDPWPKKRHHGRRLIQPRFLSVLADRLVPGGTATIVTDHAEYADWIAGVLEGQSDLVPGTGTTRVDALPGRRTTKYERKGREAGSRIHYFTWKRPPGAAPGSPPAREEAGAMPNVLLEGTPAAPDLLGGFQPGTWQGEHRDTPVLVKFVRAYGAGDEWLVETLVQEGGFHQHLAVQVTRKSPDRILVKPSAIGFPRPTWGVKEAVRRVAALLVEAHPDLSIHSSGVGEVAAS